MFTKNKDNNLILCAIGVVYGDIGTSPLYAIKSCFSASSIAVNEANILGLISLIIWGLFLVVSMKYIKIVLNADNQGEGGILALSTLCRNLKLKKYTHIPIILGVIGSSLFFGDAVITPAISVLSALEGISLVSNFMSNYIVIIAIILLTLLFISQKNGSGKIGALFGPIMVIWFATLCLIGGYSIITEPSILRAFIPIYALKFVINNGYFSILIIGCMILVLTGAEALYADLGHFGKNAIKKSWYYLVFPSLLINYLGQGALLLRSPEAIANPFYLLVPEIALYPLVFLSTIATIIASQAVISGLYSITWQAIMLDYLPRMNIEHTSSNNYGQIYAPVVNYILYFLVIGAVLFFRTSENLSVAYGLSVAGIMLITTILIFILAYNKWRWSKFKLSIVFVPLLFIDLIFVFTNMFKLFKGAWYAIIIAYSVTYIIFVWQRGNKALQDQKFPIHQKLGIFLRDYVRKEKRRIPGTAIFMSRSPDKVPNSLIVHLKHNKFLHEKLIFISINTRPVPKISRSKKYSIGKFKTDAYIINTKFGFKEVPDLQRIMGYIEENGIINESDDITFFLSKGIPVASKNQYLNGFAKRLYIFFAKNSVNAYEFFKIPHDKVIELGVRYKV